METLLTPTRFFAGPLGVVAEIRKDDLVSGSFCRFLALYDEVGLVRATMDLLEEPDDLETKLSEAFLGEGVRVSAPIAEADMLRACTSDGEATLHWGDGEVRVATADDTERLVSCLSIENCQRANIAAISGQHLYLGMPDARSGFSILSGNLADPSAPAAEFALRGANRYSLNSAVSAIAPVSDGVLIGTAALAGYEGQVGNWGPELILLNKDGEWDLIVGQPRFSLNGLKLPASGQTPGFGSNVNASIAQILVGDQTVVVTQDYAGPMEADRRNVAVDLLAYQGAVRIYSSADLVTWQTIPNELGDVPGAVTCACLHDGALWLGFEAIEGTNLPVQRIELQ